MELSTAITGDIGVALTRLRCGQMGHVFRELPTQDQGIDAVIEIADKDGKHTGRLIGVQIKCGQSFFKRSKEKSVTYGFKSKHIRYWQGYSLPVIVVLCDPKQEKCYWSLIPDDNFKDDGPIDIQISRRSKFDKSARDAIDAVATSQFVQSHPYADSKIEIGLDGRRRRIVHAVLDEQKHDDESIRRKIRSLAFQACRPRVREHDRSGVPPPQRNEVIEIFVFESPQHRLIGQWKARATFDPVLDGVFPQTVDFKDVCDYSLATEDDTTEMGLVVEFWSEIRDQLVRVFSDYNSALTSKRFGDFRENLQLQAGEMIARYDGLGISEPSSDNFTSIVQQFFEILQQIQSLTQRSDDGVFHQTLNDAQKLKTQADYVLYGKSR